MMFVHDETRKYAIFMKSQAIWFGKGESLTDRLYNVYIYFKLPALVVMLSACFAGLYLNKDVIILSDGTVFNALMFFDSVLLNVFHAANRNELDRTLKMLDARFSSHGEPWKVEIREKYTRPAWTYIIALHWYNRIQVYVYLVIPAVMDLMLHRVFDVLDVPVVLPSPMSSYILHKPTWGVKFYAFHILGIWCLKQCYDTLSANISSYLLLTIYCVGEIEILRGCLNKPYDGTTKAKLKNAVKEHVDILKLHKEFKEAAGSRVAFHTLLISVTLTIIIYACLKTDDSTQRTMCMILCVPYICALCIFCLLGQRLQNEVRHIQTISASKGDKLFQEFCDLPWYDYGCCDRRTLQMVLRQAMDPLTMDYHSAMPMNCSTLTQQTNTIYSCLTLLQRTVQ